MAGVRIEVGELEGAAELRQVISQIQNFDRRGLGEKLAVRTESQVRRRIQDEKRGPRGPWPKWSKNYAKSRAGSGGSLLVRGNYLLDSISSSVSDDEVLVGTNKIYAATHQFGDQQTVTVGAHIRTITQAFGRQLKQRVAVSVKAHQVHRNIPARPFLWWSTDNIDELRDVAIAFLEQTALRR